MIDDNNSPVIGMRTGTLPEASLGRPANDLDIYRGGYRMDKLNSLRSWLLGSTLLIVSLVFTSSSFAQLHTPPVWDTAMNPHDFTNEYYAANGIVGKSIIWRRTGSDGLSVFGKTSDPRQSLVRVIVTVPAYDNDGLVTFWYPLGEITNAGFTDNKLGFSARQMAALFPIYVFPDAKYSQYNTIVGTRQAALIDNTWVKIYPGAVLNPLGIREVFQVNYTAKAHSKEGFEMMQYMAKKNGVAADNMPLIKSMEDIRMLKDEGYVILGSDTENGNGLERGQFAISPIITDPREGVIANDAFLWMSSRDGKPLAGEMMFVDQFNCLQQTGDWCQ